jgi:hypothetical protein
VNRELNPETSGQTSNTELKVANGQRLKAKGRKSWQWLNCQIVKLFENGNETEGAQVMKKPDVLSANECEGIDSMVEL